MKTISLSFLLLLSSSICFAQSRDGVISISAGYLLSSDHFKYDINPYWSMSGSLDRDSTMSLDASYYFSDRFGLHCGLFYAILGVSQSSYSAFNHQEPYHDFSTTTSFRLAEIGPEVLLYKNRKSNVFLRLDVGHTFSSANVDFYYGSHFGDWSKSRKNEWSLGAGIGYRYYLGETIGIAAQLSYHHISKWYINDFVDCRVGLAFRF